MGEDEDDEHLISRRTKGILHSIVAKLKANDNKVGFYYECFIIYFSEKLF